MSALRQPLPLARFREGAGGGRAPGAGAVLALALALLAVQETAYLLAARLAPPGFLFSGDLSSEIVRGQTSWIAQAAAGRVGMESLFSAEPQRAFLLHPLFTPTGLAAGMAGAPAATAWRILRWLCGIGLVFAIWRVALRVVETRGAAVWLTAAVSTASGFAWLLPAGGTPCALIAAFPSTLVLTDPAAAAGTALLLSGAILWHPAVEGGARAQLGLMTVVALSGFIAPHSIVIWTAAAAACAFKEERATRRGIGGTLSVAVGLLPPAGYAAALLRAQPELAAWWAGDGTVTPAWAVAVAVAPFGAAASAAVARFLRWGAGRSEGDSYGENARARAIRWLLAWGAAGALLAVTPVPGAQRAAAGFAAPVLLLAGRLVWETSGRRRVLPAALSLLFALSVAASIALGLVLARDAAEDTRSGTLLSGEYLPAVSRLRDDVAPGETVLASYAVASHLPGRAGVRVFAGHAALTFRCADRRSELVAYLAGAPAFDREGFLRRHGIRYLLYGPAEARMGTWRPAGDPAWRPVWTEGEVTLYRRP